MILNIPLVSPTEDLIPTLGSSHAAGYDLRANIAEPITLAPFKRVRIPSGQKMAIPEGFSGFVCPRSGLADKYGITVLNAPGVIDADFRGDIGVILINLGEEPFIIEPKMRIAQMVFVHHLRARFILSEGLSETGRGANGFGSTGHA